MIKKVALVAVAALTLASCQPPRVTTKPGLTANFSVVSNAIISGDADGALLTAAAGAASGELGSKIDERPGYCSADDQFGEDVTIQCPSVFDQKPSYEQTLR